MLKFLSGPAQKKTFLRMTVRNLILILILCAIVYVVRGGFSGDTRDLKRLNLMFSAMSTVGNIELYGTDMDELKKARDDAHAAIMEVNQVCNIFDPASELARLNATASETPFVCSNLLWDLIVRSRAFSKMTDEYFDITCAPLVALWREAGEKGTLPTSDELEQAKALCGFRNVELDLKAQSVKFKKSGVSLNPGGIAKGYALDLAAAAARKHGIDCGWIDLGGNVLTLTNPPPHKDTYTASIKNPFDRETSIGTVPMKKQAISTSGNYERFVTIDGHRYTHIINPKTGWPVENTASVTVLAERGIESDVLSTAIFIGGTEMVEKIRSYFPDLNALIIRGTPDNPEIITSGTVWSQITFQSSSK